LRRPPDADARARRAGQQALGGDQHAGGVEILVVLHVGGEDRGIEVLFLFGLGGRRLVASGSHDETHGMLLL
jgi:hypothetical protein